MKACSSCGWMLLDTDNACPMCGVPAASAPVPPSPLLTPGVIPPYPTSFPAPPFIDPLRDHGRLPGMMPPPMSPAPDPVGLPPLVPPEPAPPARVELRPAPRVVHVTRGVLGLGLSGFIGESLARVRRDRGVIVVHGGGGLAWAKLGKPSASYLEPVDEAALATMKHTIAVEQNAHVCDVLADAGCKVEGFDGVSARVIAAERRAPRLYGGAGLDPIDLGFVGDPTAVHEERIAASLDRGFVPVIASLGSDASGQTYKLDSAAVALRVAWELGCRSLFIVTHSGGGAVSQAATFKPDRARELLETSDLDASTVAQVIACREVIRCRGRSAHIVSASDLRGDVVGRELADPGCVGAAFVPQ